MKNEELKSFFEREWYEQNKFSGISGRYVTNKDLEILIEQLEDFYKFQKIGKSVKGFPIYRFKIGNGKIKVLAWSQMHGNESTTTKALFDLFYSLKRNSKNSVFASILDNLSLYVIPILNPDGANAYTRVNANGVDLNRDLQNLSQPESELLKAQYDQIAPDFCLNLHDQRTIFSAGERPFPATLSFLTPSMDEERNIDEYRKKSMGLIAGVVEDIKDELPEQIGRYDDAFNINCAGDTFQYNKTPTVLFEAGHYAGDYQREEVRRYVFLAYLSCLFQISQKIDLESLYEAYLNIPENRKLFNDIIIRNVKFGEDYKDVAIQFKETLKNNDIEFIPIVDRIEETLEAYGHREIDAERSEVRLADNSPITENVIVNKIILKNEKIEVKCG